MKQIIDRINERGCIILVELDLNCTKAIVNPFAVLGKKPIPSKNLIKSTNTYFAVWHFCDKAGGILFQA